MLLRSCPLEGRGRAPRLSGMRGEQTSPVPSSHEGAGRRAAPLRVPWHPVEKHELAREVAVRLDQEARFVQNLGDDGRIHSLIGAEGTVEKWRTKCGWQPPAKGQFRLRLSAGDRPESLCMKCFPSGLPKRPEPRTTCGGVKCVCENKSGRMLHGPRHGLSRACNNGIKFFCGGDPLLSFNLGINTVVHAEQPDADLLDPPCPPNPEDRASPIRRSSHCKGGLRSRSAQLSVCVTIVTRGTICALRAPLLHASARCVVHTHLAILAQPRLMPPS